LGSLLISVAVVVCCLVSAAVGIFLRVRLPNEHFDGDSKDVVKSVMGIIATMVALVLSLLIASAKSTYDTQSNEMQQLAVNAVQLDRALTAYGPQAADARKLLRQSVIRVHDHIWPADAHLSANLDPTISRGDLQDFYNMMENLAPSTDVQRHAQATALQLVGILSHTRMLMFEQIDGTVSWPLLFVLIFWISVLFLGFGLFARLHVIVGGTLFIGAVSVACAIFLMLELNQPYQGLLRIGDAPVQAALAQIGH
jgi:Protein of unknown function (DUF4239)